MSIAFSVNIVPSRILRRLSFGIYLLSVLSLVYASLILDILARPITLTVVAAICLVNALLLNRFWSRQASFQLLMSDTGDLILRQLNSRLDVFESWQVKLHSATVFSTCLILICLRDSDGKDRRLIVFSDSIASSAHRQLCVSLRWLQHKSQGDEKTKVALTDGNF